MENTAITMPETDDILKGLGMLVALKWFIKIFIF